MHIHGSSLLVDILGSYVMVSTKVGRGLQRRLEGLGLLSEFLRRKLEEEVDRREIELITRRLSELREVPDAIDIERVARHL